MVRREGTGAMLYPGWVDRFPAIVQAASRIKAQSFLIDGEAVMCRDDGLTDFEALPPRPRCGAVRFRLDRASGRRPAQRAAVGSQAATRQAARQGQARDPPQRVFGHDDATVFEHACRMGLEAAAVEHGPALGL
jgi:bifunctional non-homologous end joining protein LigD